MPTGSAGRTTPPKPPGDHPPDSGVVQPTTTVDMLLSRLHRDSAHTIKRSYR